MNHVYTQQQKAGVVGLKLSGTSLCFRTSTGQIIPMLHTSYVKQVRSSTHAVL